VTFRQFIDLTFEHVGRIDPERDSAGQLMQLLPQDRYKDALTAKLHRYGAGPFCRFRTARKRREAGLYVLMLDGMPIYAGECVDLEKRWGPNGYGAISPRNCFEGGQPTNCRVNAAILAASREGKRLDLWIAPLGCTRDERLATETRLIQALRPAWNRAKMG
jgi:hypothetical protein